MTCPKGVFKQPLDNASYVKMIMNFPMENVRSQHHLKIPAKYQLMLTLVKIPWIVVIVKNSNPPINLMASSMNLVKNKVQLIPNHQQLSNLKVQVPKNLNLNLKLTLNLNLQPERLNLLQILSHLQLKELTLKQMLRRQKLKLLQMLIFQKQTIKKRMLMRLISWRLMVDTFTQYLVELFPFSEPIPTTKHKFFIPLRKDFLQRQFFLRMIA